MKSRLKLGAVTDLGAGAWDASAPQSGPQEILVAATDLEAAREVLAAFEV